MIVSLNWLSDHIDLTGVSTDDLCQWLTFAGVEVEGVEKKGVSSDRVVVAQIVSFVPHPEAEKLSVCQVEAGQGTPLQIVCGAKNFKAGDKVPLALEGAVLPGDVKIKKAKMRGVESQGMMCSGQELGLSADAEGLLILSPHHTVGTPLGQALGSDTLIEVEVTPNRPDLLSHAGLAREISVITGRPLKTAFPAPSTAGLSSTAQVRLDDSNGCPFYQAQIIRGVKVGPSPEWLRAKLEAIGQRSINNIVDITNYVLQEIGQPLHAFDLSEVRGGIVVRSAQAGEKLTTLDGVERELTTDDLIIADQERGLAVAGIMGGEKSGVTEATTDVLIEAAWFQPKRIRRTSRRLGLSTDSSYRFERGVNPDLVTTAAQMAADLVVKLAGGTIEAPVSSGQPPTLTQTVPLTPADITRLLGVSVPPSEVEAILTRLGLTQQANGWSVPNARADLQRPVDLIEEIARIRGLDAIPSRAAAIFTPASDEDKFYDVWLRHRERLVDQGFYEAKSIKLISAAQLAQSLGTDRRALEPLALKNPLSEDHTHLRPSLIPGLLATAALNLRQGAEALRFFELGTVFAAPREQGEGSVESQSLALLLSGPHAPGSWLKKAPYSTDIYDLIGIIQGLSPHRPFSLRTVTHPLCVLAAEITLGGKTVGLAGQLHPAQARAINAKHPIFIAEFHLGLLTQMTKKSTRFEEMPRFPAITRDVALEIDAAQPAGAFDDFFGKLKEPLLSSVGLFDVFYDPSGQKLPADRKSLAFTLTYRDPQRTLEAKEVDAIHSKIIEQLTQKLKATVR